ncbi:hypothetical protein [cf. Phormidesmis sp. LEGE 11477]|uniref:hypothetical protein n=1 Tax=cf. Phormidesmis sp. LEGE 11477 TaxID=1828680 RepID=UPI0018826E40|nr:hypothetical protein [cf. Phormidesmis sp. LEGE 11477]MBE9064829.1 hypothetical protein [cf. Phormidesmis sp. LEGE 11477]
MIPIPPGAEDFLWTLKTGIWSIGTASWVFGISDRTLAALMDGYLSAIDIVQLCTATFFFASWLLLRPMKMKSKQGAVQSAEPLLDQP